MSYYSNNPALFTKVPDCALNLDDMIMTNELSVPYHASSPGPTYLFQCYFSCKKNVGTKLCILLNSHYLCGDGGYHVTHKCSESGILPV